jgi:hypothetical protein|tara:strand:- start:2023 stop:2166 length:144 start_codon:yes stop_codon:yes gene_type:complete
MGLRVSEKTVTGPKAGPFVAANMRTAAGANTVRPENMARLRQRNKGG